MATASISTRVARTALAAFVLLALAACGRAGMDDLNGYIDEVKARPGGKIKPLPEPKPYEAFVYQAFESRDPFSTIVPGEAEAQATKGKGTGVTPDFKRPKEITEGFPLDAMRMVGHLLRDKQLWALVRDPEGTLHRVRPGNYMGQNHGRITRVNEQRVELTEIVPDGLGGWMERQASIALSEQ